MAYTDINCMEYFTAGQGERMRNAISSLPYLQHTIADNCSIQELSSINQLCYSENKTLTISDIQDNTTTWQVSSNVTILSSNNGSITVRAKYSNSTGNGWVRAILSNGITLQEDFSVGVPLSSNLRIITTGNGINLFSRTWQELFVVGSDVENIEWRVRGSFMTRSCGDTCLLIYPMSTNHGQLVTIGIRQSNECGYSSWKYQDFKIYKKSSDGGIEIMH